MRHTFAPVRRRTGFTLVEVLVALLIMSVIAALGWQGVDAMSRAREHSAGAVERTLRLDAVIGQWEHDLQAVYDSPGVPGLSFDGATLRLARRTEGGVQIVVWALRDGRWWRWAGPALTRANALEEAWMASWQLAPGDPAQLELLGGVSGWQVYFFRGQTWTNAQSSGDVASGDAPPAPGQAAQRTLLPSGVRLQLDLPEGPLTRDVMLAPQMP